MSDTLYCLPSIRLPNEIRTRDFLAGNSDTLIMLAAMILTKVQCDTQVISPSSIFFGAKEFCMLCGKLRNLGDIFPNLQYYFVQRKTTFTKR